MNNSIFTVADIAHWVTEAADTGAALIPCAIEPDFLKALAVEINDGPFEEATEGSTYVRQKFERFAFLYQPVGLPLLAQLQEEIEHLIKSASTAFLILQYWQPIDIVVQKYDTDSFLTAHQDLVRHPSIIVSLTVTGLCKFEVLETRSGPVTKTLYPFAGDIVLLSAPGLTPEIDTENRPFHRVSGSLDKNTPRISVTFRDNFAPHRTIPGFTYANH